MPEFTDSELHESTRCPNCDTDLGDVYSKCEDCYCNICGESFYDFECKCAFCAECRLELTLEGCDCR